MIKFPKKTIPGQLSNLDMIAICNLAKEVVPNGKILEIGSLYGLSSWLLAQNSDPTVTVHCIDPWKHEPWMNKVRDEFCAPDLSKEVFEETIKDCEGIIALQGYSPFDFDDWVEPIDLFFDDAVHSNPIFRKNLYFWQDFVRSGGVISGHDFHLGHPDIINEVIEISKKWKSSLNVLGSVWFIRKP